MNKKNYIDKIELILNTSGKYITRKEKDMILDYVNYFKTKNNVIEDKNIELVIEIERLNNIINELEKFLNELKIDTDNVIKYARSKNDDEEIIRLNREFNMTDMILVKLQELKGDGNNESVEI